MASAGKEKTNIGSESEQAGDNKDQQQDTQAGAKSLPKMETGAHDSSRSVSVNAKDIHEALRVSIETPDCKDTDKVLRSRRLSTPNSTTKTSNSPSPSSGKTSTSSTPPPSVRGTLTPPMGRPGVKPIGPTGGRGKVPNRPGFTWKGGFRLEAMDFMQKWYAARIVQVDEDDHTILIHFEGWNQRYDEWVNMLSERLRPITRHSERKEKPRHTRAEHKVGENVMARWTDCRMYPAKVLGINVNGSYEVLFYDGVKKTVQPINVQNVPADWEKQGIQFPSIPSVPMDSKAGKNTDKDDKAGKSISKDKANPAGQTLPDKKRGVSQRHLVAKGKMVTKECSPLLPRRITRKSQQGKDNTTSPTTPEKKEQSHHASRKRKLIVGGCFMAKRARLNLSGKLKPKVSSPGPAAEKGECDSLSPKPSETTKEKSAEKPTVKVAEKVKMLPKVKPRERTNVRQKFKAMRREKGQQKDSKPVKEARRRDGKETKDYSKEQTKPVSSTVTPSVPDKETPEASDTPGEWTTVPVTATTPRQSCLMEMLKSTHIPTATHSPSVFTQSAISACSKAAVKKKVRHHSGVSSTSEDTATAEDTSQSTDDGEGGKKAAAPKEFKVEDDHNRYKCPFENCGKGFRKETLVEYHIKYYHTEDGKPVPPPPPRKRKKTTSVCSTDSEISVGGKCQSGKGIKRKRTSTNSSMSESVQETIMVKEEILGGTTDAEGGEDGGQADTSEVETRTSTTLDDLEGKEASLGQDDMLDTAEEAEEEGNKDEVVNCICQINEENGLMIQCEVCLCWQHASCLHITKDTLPSKYVCCICMNPPGVRDSAQFIWDQDWLKEGSLARFSFLPEESADRRSPTMMSLHNYIDDLYNAGQVLHSLRWKLKVLQDKEEPDPELHLWTKNWDMEAMRVKEEELSREEESINVEDVAEHVVATETVAMEIETETVVDTGEMQGELTREEMEEHTGEIEQTFSESGYLKNTDSTQSVDETVVSAKELDKPEVKGEDSSESEHIEQEMTSSLKEPTKSVEQSIDGAANISSVDMDKEVTEVPVKDNTTDMVQSEKERDECTVPSDPVENEMETECSVDTSTTAAMETDLGATSSNCTTPAMEEIPDSGDDTSEKLAWSSSHEDEQKDLKTDPVSDEGKKTSDKMDPRLTDKAGTSPSQETDSGSTSLKSTQGGSSEKEIEACPSKFPEDQCLPEGAVESMGRSMSDSVQEKTSNATNHSTEPTCTAAQSKSEETKEVDVKFPAGSESQVQTDSDKTEPEDKDLSKESLSGTKSEHNDAPAGGLSRGSSPQNHKACPAEQSTTGKKTPEGAVEEQTGEKQTVTTPKSSKEGLSADMVQARPLSGQGMSEVSSGNVEDGISGDIDKTDKSERQSEAEQTLSQDTEESGTTGNGQDRAREGGVSSGNGQDRARDGGVSSGNGQDRAREGGVSSGNGQDRARDSVVSSGNIQDRAREGGVGSGNGQERAREGGVSSSSAGPSDYMLSPVPSGVKLAGSSLWTQVGARSKEELAGLVEVEMEEADEMMDDSDLYADCERNLLNHVVTYQDEVARRLDLLEEEVAAMEAAEEQVHPLGPGHGTHNVLADVPYLKRCLHRLLYDLSKVNRMAIYHS